MCDPEKVEVITGADDLHIEIASGTHRIECVTPSDRRFEAGRYFWGSGWAPLCHLLEIECQDTATDRVVLGSFQLDRPPSTDVHEVLVGDPQLHVNRVHFPSAYRGSGCPSGRPAATQARNPPAIEVTFRYPIFCKLSAASAERNPPPQ